MLKIFVTSAISFVMGAALMYFLVAGPNQEVDSDKLLGYAEKIESKSPQTSSVHTDYIRQLEELNRQLSKDLQVARGDKQNLADKGLSSEIILEQDSAKLEEYYNVRKKSDDFSEYLQTVAGESGLGYVKDLAAKFDEEIVDAQWAPDYEEKLYNLLGSDELSGSVVPQSIVCKSQRCQIKVAVASVEQANQVMQSFSEAVISSQLSIDKSMVISAPDVDAGVVSLYVARDVNVRIFE